MDDYADHPGEPAEPERPHQPDQQPDPQPEVPTRVDRLEMVAPSLWTRGMTTAAVMLAVAGFWFYDFIIQVIQAPQAPWRMWALVVGPPLLFALYVAWRWWDKPKQPRAVVFHDDFVELPVSPDSKRTVELAYGDVQGVMMMSRGQMGIVFLDTGKQQLSYTEGQFARPKGPFALREEIMRRVRQLPNAQQILDAMRERQKLARIATSKNATVTKAIMGLLAAYFGVELWMGVADDPFGLIELGANAPALIDQGQYFRLISANFLHQGWVHIIMNGIALLFLGTFVERLVGSWRVLLIYLLGAIGGSLGSYLLGPGTVSVGSSTAIFGLFGAFLALHIRYWRTLPPPFRQSIAWWVVIIGINAALPVIVPIIDYAAHIFGFVAGGVTAWAVLLPMEELKPDRRPSTLVKVVTGLVTAVFAAGLIQAGIYAVETHPKDEAQVYAKMLDDALAGETAPEQVNFIAWTMATDPNASAAQLEEARRAVKEVIDEQDDRLEIRDTLATVNYRLAQKSTGDKRLELIDEAITIERGVLDEAQQTSALGDGKATFAAQLARFLNYRRQIEGPLIRDLDIEQAPKLRFDSADVGSVEIEAPQPASQPVAIFAVARVDDKVEGLVRTCLEAGQKEGDVTEAEAIGKWPNNLRLLTALVEPAENCDDQFDWWPMTSQVRQYP